MKSVTYSYPVTRNGFPASVDKKPTANALPLWVEVLIPVTKKEFTAHWGRKCKSFDRDCCLCKAWKQWEKDGRAPFLYERNDLLKLSASV